MSTNVYNKNDTSERYRFHFGGKEMNKRQLVVGIGVIFIVLIVFLQTISQKRVEEENFEVVEYYNDNAEDYEKLIEEFEKEEALAEEEQIKKIHKEEDQLLDRGKRFINENEESVKRWRDSTLNKLPEVKPNSAVNGLDIQNPIEVAKQNKDQNQKDLNYAKDRLEDLMKHAEDSAKQVSAPNVVSNSSKPYGGTHISDTCYIPRGRKSCAPTYIISGAMKCGTTSMYAYLTSHPKVLPLNPAAKLNGKPILANKEVRYWLDPTYSSMLRSKGDADSFNEYLDLFYPISSTHPYFEFSTLQYNDYITGEASPMYICQFGVAQRIYNHLPEVKIIIMLRNPIDRAYSELWFKDSLTRGKGQDVDTKLVKQKYQNCLLYESDLLSVCNVKEYTAPKSTLVPQDLNLCVTGLHNLVRGQKCEPRNQWLCDKYKAIGGCSVNNLKNSLYSLQLREWVQYFGEQDNLLIIKSEDFYDNTSHWMKITSKFLGIDDNTDEFNWDSVTGTAFNIINPGTLSATGMEIANPNGGGLKMGATSAENVSQYPDIDDDVRAKLATFFEPINRHLSILINKPVFWGINSQKGE